MNHMVSRQDIGFVNLDAGDQCCDAKCDDKYQ